MGRTLKLTTTYNLGAGDGASAETQTASTSLSSGLSTTIIGSAASGAAVEYVVASYLGTGNKAKGVYVENRDATHSLLVKLGTGTGGAQVMDIKIAAGGVACLHDETDAITHINLQGVGGDADFILCFCE